MPRKFWSTHVIYYNAVKDAFFIENTNCKKTDEEYIDVVKHCLNCPYLYGIKLNRKKMILVCQPLQAMNNILIHRDKLKKEDLYKLLEKVRHKKHIQRKYKLSEVSYTSI